MTLATLFALLVACKHTSIVKQIRAERYTAKIISLLS